MTQISRYKPHQFDELARKCLYGIFEQIVWREKISLDYFKNNYEEVIDNYLKNNYDPINKFDFTLQKFKPFIYEKIHDLVLLQIKLDCTSKYSGKGLNRDYVNLERLINKRLKKLIFNNYEEIYAARVFKPKEPSINQDTFDHKSLTLEEEHGFKGINFKIIKNFKNNKNKKPSDSEVWIAIILFLISLVCFTVNDSFFYLIGLILFIPTLLIMSKVIFNKY